MFGVIKPNLKSPPNAAGKYKASPCKFFMQGLCNRGDQCTWSHGEEGMMGMGGMGMDMSMMGMGMGGMGMGGMGMGGMGMGMGGKGKGKGKGKSKGAVGGAPTPALPSGDGEANEVKNYKKTPCKFFLTGQCAKGEECTFSHGEAGDIPQQALDGNYKKTPCKFYAMGQCSKGRACTFLHMGEDSMPMGGKMGGKGCMGGWGMGFDSWSMGMGKGMMGKSMAMGKSMGKGMGKTGNKGKGPGHLLPRTRISEAPFTGTVLEWKGKYGWIQPAETIEHPKAAKHGGKLFVGLDDTGGQGLTEGATVTFHIWEDASGLGADEITII